MTQKSTSSWHSIWLITLCLISKVTLYNWVPLWYTDSFHFTDNAVAFKSACQTKRTRCPHLYCLDLTDIDAGGKRDLVDANLHQIIKTDLFRLSTIGTTVCKWSSKQGSLYSCCMEDSLIVSLKQLGSSQTRSYAWQQLNDSINHLQRTKALVMELTTVTEEIRKRQHILDEIAAQAET